MTFVPDATAILIVHVTDLAADDDVAGAADDYRAATSADLDLSSKSKI